MATRCGVNQWIACMGIVVQFACQVGRPPRAAMGVTVGRIVAPTAEPGLADSLRNGLGAALAAKGGQGGADTARVDLVVRSATTGPTAVGLDQQVHTARLEIAVHVYGTQPRQVVLSDSRSYPVGSADTLGASSARASAFDDLARSLTQDAATWILYGPGPPASEGN